MYSCRYPTGGGCDSVHLTYTQDFGAVSSTIRPLSHFYMVLFPVAPPAQASTLAQWYAEVIAHEREVDGFVNRGGRWLQRLERARVGQWSRSLEPSAAKEAAKLSADQRRLHGALHRLEERQSPANRAILRRSTLKERVDVLCGFRLRQALMADVAAELAGLDERRRGALLRPGPDSLIDLVEQPAAEEGADLDPMRGEADWEAASNALTEEWQLMLDVLVRAEGRTTTPAASAEVVAASSGGADGSSPAAATGPPPASSQAGGGDGAAVCRTTAVTAAAIAAENLANSALATAALVNSALAGKGGGGGKGAAAAAEAEAGGSAEAGASSSAAANSGVEFGRQLREGDVRASCGVLRSSMGAWLGEVVSLAGWSGFELEAWAELTAQERASLLAAGLLVTPPPHPNMGDNTVPPLTLSHWVDRDMRTHIRTLEGRPPSAQLPPGQPRPPSAQLPPAGPPAPTAAGGPSSSLISALERDAVERPSSSASGLSRLGSRPASRPPSSRPVSRPPTGGLSRPTSGATPRIEAIRMRCRMRARRAVPCCMCCMCA